MKLSLAEQRKQIDEVSRIVELKIKSLKSKRKILINAFNSIDKNQENILESGSILAQESRKIMNVLIPNF